MHNISYLVGIDEAGRGPLAGPVSVGAVLVPVDFDWTRVAGAKDSKQMTPKARGEVYEEMLKLKETGVIRFVVALSPAHTIDTKGIVPAIRAALEGALLKLEVNPQACRVLLDGGLKAPKEYPNQETIIKGDAKEKVIALASIAAKVLRDRHMIKEAEKYPQYGFEIHKGYGTKKHQEAIQTHGLSAIHRRSFCRAFDMKT
jgi:ribonuclease HII